MINFDLGYLFIVTLGLGACYLIFYYFIYYYHTDSPPPSPTSQSFYSLLTIISFSLLVYLISYQLPGVIDGFGNRVIHAMGGGFLGILVCFLVAQDTKLKLNRFKYFVFCFMLVTTLGVANEIIECVLQNMFHLTAAISINDTWFDLISNTVGALLGGLILIPFLPKFGRKPVK